MTTSPQDGPGPEPAARSSRDQQMIDLRRTLNELDALLGAPMGADNWGLAEVAGAPVAGAPVAGAPGAGAPGAGTPGAGMPAEPEASVDTPPASVEELDMPSAILFAPRASDNRSLQLITRFVAGAVILGLEELVKSGEKWEAAAPPEVLTRAGSTQEDTSGELLRYWLLGMLTSARRRAWSLALDALEAPGSVVGMISRTTNRAMGSWLFRPIRKPVTSAVDNVLNRMAARSESWIAEGRQEEQISRWIATNGVTEIIDGVINMVARSPEIDSIINMVARSPEIDSIINTVAQSPEIDSIINTVAQSPEISAMVRRQLSQQSVGLASTVVDTGRRLSSVSDDLAETFVRRLLRRGPVTGIAPITPDEELPPSFRMPNKQVQSNDG